MPAIDIRRAYRGDAQSARTAVERVADAIAKEYGVSHRWHGDELHFERGGVKGRITLAGGEIRVRAQLGLLMGALKPVIEREIERRLDENIA